MNSENPKYLYHFTKLPYLLHILNTKTLTLTNPEKWEDENDRCSIKRYKDLSQIKTLLALCFTATKESFYFWKLYGSEGVRIEFIKEELEKKLKLSVFEPVKYKSLKELKNVSKSSSIIEELPFLKRKHGYEHEREWRAIYKSGEVEETREIPIGEENDDLSTIIKEIALNPWICDKVFNSIKEVLKEKLTPRNITTKEVLEKESKPTNIIRSGVCKHKDWIQIINNITNTYNLVIN